MSHYGGVICYVYITSLEMCTFEILSPRIDIVDYLVPRWHVSFTSCNLLVFAVNMMLDILAIYQRELFPNTSCLLTIGTHLCVLEIIDHLYIGLCFYLPYLLPRDPIVFHTTCGSCYFLELV